MDLAEDDQEEMRIKKARMRKQKRQQITREFMQMMQDSATESAAETVRWIGGIAVFIVIMCLIVPH
ncbi:hypothetical protein [Acidithiobacillus sp. HP-11]|uniref:hypothetical protein n=1 Tax=Acidithiobacillus sp. HP-11 TaxID=2697656 RepID=UPI00187A122B|nr:hypothetical protein [Acidithiobacillus sp. HP-11]MBE7566837.1 hypothetical protein [Acidithiobacillus sp. HP-11]